MEPFPQATVLVPSNPQPLQKTGVVVNIDEQISGSHHGITPPHLGVAACSLAAVSSSKSWEGLRSMILRNLIIALAYVATGWFGLTFFSAPPGYATTIFLPAGIAIGAVLFFWFPALIGIFVGSYFLNILVGYAIFHQQVTTQAVANAVVIATTSTLQAALGGWLFRSKLSFRSVTLISRHNLLLLSAWAPLICLTSATLSVTGLWLLNTVSTAAFLTNWLHWWIGDTFGVLVLLPWMLFFLPADVQIKKWTQQMLHNNARLH